MNQPSLRHRIMRGRHLWLGVVLTIGLALGSQAAAKECQRETPLPTDVRLIAPASEVAEAVARFAVINGRPPAHGGRWGKANLEVCLAVLASARERTEVFLAHQTATMD